LIENQFAALTLAVIPPAQPFHQQPVDRGRHVENQPSWRVSPMFTALPRHSGTLIETIERHPSGSRGGSL
jgi:hypothetical protein